MPKVSVLVPVYNVESYLEHCLDSLQNQTCSDLEIVCINDGSTDHSAALLAKRAETDPRIKVYTYENSGISATRNRALAHATGDYILFVDSDDFMEKNAIEVMMKAALEEQAECVMCGFVMDYGWFHFYRRVARHKVWNNIQALHALVNNQGINNYPWGKLFRKECFEGISFPESQRGFEDTLTIFKAIANAHTIVTIPNRFYHYVQHSGSLTNNMSLETVMKMRDAYHYQQAMLQKMFPQESFCYDLQYYNTDMVIIYTLLLFCRKDSTPHFQKDTFSFSRLPFLFKPAYYAWLSLACAKFGWNIRKVAGENA